MSNSITETELDCVNLRQLVPLARELVELIGIVNTYTLLEDHGGVPLRVPVSVERDTDTAAYLKGLLPLDAVVKLCGQYPGQWLNLPKADRIVRQVRDFYLRADRDRSTLRKCARKYRLTPRQVINICHYEDDKVIKPPADDRQVDWINEL
jgi:hypothetical protein